MREKIFLLARIASGAAVIALLAPAPLAAAPVCQSDCGDCNADFQVTIDELVQCVNEALGSAPHTCVACDVGRNGAVEVSDLISAVLVAVGESGVSLVRTTCASPCRGNGCASADPNGLQACDDGTVRASRCTDDGNCTDVAVVESEGGEACFGVCRFEPPFLEVVDEQSGYRVLNFGPVGSLPDRGAAHRGGAAGDVPAGLAISPKSEAAVRLVEEQGLAAFDGVGLGTVTEAVEEANRETDFSDNSLEQAAGLATETAQNDPVVQDAIRDAVAVTIRIGEAEAASGAIVSVEVTLSTGGADVAATQNDLSFPPDARVLATPNGRPDCSVVSSIHKNATSFGFQPPGCRPDQDCTAVRALVLALDNTDPIPNRSTLYTCRVIVAPGASGAFPLNCSNAAYSSPAGETLEANCTGGAVEVIP